MGQPQVDREAMPLMRHQSLLLRHCYAISTTFRRRASLAHGRPKKLKIKTRYGILQKLKARRRSKAELAQPCPEPIEGLAWLY
jgi:hypothetical protein